MDQYDQYDCCDANADQPQPSQEQPDFWSMFLPACQLGLPCDDCGMCH